MAESRVGPLTFRELTGGLVWPVLLRALPLSIQPPRLVLGVLTTIVVVGIGRIFDSLQRGDNDPAIGAMLIEGVPSGASALLHDLAGLEILRGMGHAIVAGAAAMNRASSDPIALGVYLLVLSAVWAVGGATISRMAAVDLASDLNMRMSEGLGFALRRWRTLWLSLLLPLALIWGLTLFLRLAGFVLFSLPGIDVIGGIVYPIMLVMGFCVVFLLLCFVLAQSMIVPAVATEGTDAWDAMQRSFAYVIGRPGRLVVYTFVLLVLGLIAIAIAQWVLDAAGQWTFDLSLSWVSEARVQAITGGADAEPNAAGSLVRFWTDAISIVLGGFGVSYYFCAGTSLYMLMRRVCDEQDIREIWMPGMVGGTIRSADRRGRR